MSRAFDALAADRDAGIEDWIREVAAQTRRRRFLARSGAEAAFRFAARVGAVRRLLREVGLRETTARVIEALRR